MIMTELKYDFEKTTEKVNSHDVLFGNSSNSKAAQFTEKIASNIQNDFISANNFIAQQAYVVKEREVPVQSEEKITEERKGYPSWIPYNQNIDIDQEYRVVKKPTQKESDVGPSIATKQALNATTGTERTQLLNKLRNLNESDSHKEIEVQQPVVHEVRRYEKKEMSVNALKVMVAIYIAAVIAIAVIIIGITQAVGKLQTNVGNLQMSVSTMQERVIEQQNDLSILSDETRIAEKASELNMSVNTSPAKTLKLLPVSNATGYKEISNWFDKVLDWLGV